MALGALGRKTEAKAAYAKAKELGFVDPTLYGLNAAPVPQKNSSERLRELSVPQKTVDKRFAELNKIKKNVTK